MRKVALLAAVVGMALLAGPSQALGFDCDRTLDDFNRADSTNLGPNWTERSGDFAVEGNQATHPIGTGLMTYNGISAAAGCVDVEANPAGGSYAAIVVGYGGIDDNVFVKVQDNGGSAGTFDTAFFYYGDNGEPWTSQFSFDLPPFSTARIYVALVGDVAYLEVDADFDDQPEESFSVGDVPLGALGTGIGVGGWNAASMDDFSVSTCKSRPLTILAQGGPAPGTSGADSIGGSEGKDRIRAGAGKDVACGEAGKDKLSGGGANDRLSGGAGKDKLKGGPGKNRLSCGKGRREVAIADDKDKVSKSCEIVR